MNNPLDFSLPSSSTSALAAVGALSLVFLAGCTATTEATLPSLSEVTSSDDSCELSESELQTGTITFRVTNTGSQPTEFYVLESDAVSVISEVENISPTLSRDLIVVLDAGDYVARCVPGQGDGGIDTAFSVAGDSVAVSTLSDTQHVAIGQAEEAYHDFVIEQSTALLQETTTFVDLYLAGEDDAARELYPNARMYWERIEPVAESFGDLDPRLDLREADLAEGDNWTGWHAIEKDLWPPAEGYTPFSQEQREELGALLISDTQELVDRVQELEFEAFQMANGAKELLDEVATGKITGEEEIWSGTDLWDFQANVEGAKKVWDLLRPVVEEGDLEFARELDSRFNDVFNSLDRSRDGYEFVTYSQLTEEQIREFSDLVNALGESVSQLAGIVTS
jgi:iron uptake system component EfeO